MKSPVCVLSCSTSFPLVKNPLWQVVHLKSRTSVWLFWCSLKKHSKLKLNKTKQNGYDLRKKKSVWIFWILLFVKCTVQWNAVLITPCGIRIVFYLRVYFLVNSLPHNSHWCALMLLWMDSTWCFKSYACLKAHSHIVHWNGRRPEYKINAR